MAPAEADYTYSPVEEVLAALIASTNSPVEVAVQKTR